MMPTTTSPTSPAITHFGTSHAPPRRGGAPEGPWSGGGGGGAASAGAAVPAGSVGSVGCPLAAFSSSSAPFVMVRIVADDIVSALSKR
jgi:hypothetical protein